MRGVNLQGASLWSTELQGADLEKADLKLVNLTYAKFGKMSEQGAKDLLTEIPQTIGLPSRLKKLKLRLSEATNLRKAQGQNILLEEPDENAQTAFKESGEKLEFARLMSDYQNRLAVFLIKLSCQDKWIASGIIRYRIKREHRYGSDSSYFELQSSFAQCLLSLKQKKNTLGEAICPGMSEIRKWDISMLKKMASKTDTGLYLKYVAYTYPESNIKATFKCGDGLLD